MIKKNSSHNRYVLSFSAASLMHNESIKLAISYLSLKEWDEVKNQAVETNLLQSRTLNTLKRQTIEIVSRLESLSDQELLFIVNARPQEQNYLLWIAICRRYRFIGEFALEVLHERYVTLKPDLPKETFDIFFNRKLEWHPELENITDSTRQKLRQVLFKMLQQVGLINTKSEIVPVWLSPELVKQVTNPAEWMWFPVFEADIPRA